MYCGKVNIIYQGENIKSYVVDEDEKTFLVLLVNNLQIKVNKPMIISRAGPNEKIKTVFYEYEKMSEKTIDNYVIKNFLPIRFKYQINALENMKYIMNKMVLDVDGKVVEQLSS